MRPLVKCVLRCTTAANANNVQTSMTTRLATMTGTIVRQALRIVIHPRGRLVTICLECASEADAAALVADVVTLWTGTQAARILTGSRIWWTRNFDDEGQGVPDQVMDSRTK